MKIENRIKKGLEFQSIIDNGILYREETLSIYWIKNDLNHPRVGISVPTKSGNAVVRNKIKRQIRAILAHSLDFKEGIDMIIISRKRYDINNFLATKKDLESLIEKIGNHSEQKD